jgi:hypothetical protein
MARENNRGAAAIAWIEDYCLYPFGLNQGRRVKLTVTEQHAVRNVYENFPDKPLVTGPLAAYLTLLHTCGIEAKQRKYCPTFETDIWTLWNAAGPELKEVLKREGSTIVCPALGTSHPAVAA